MSDQTQTLREDRLPDLDHLARIYRLAPIGAVGYALLARSMPRYPIDWNAWELMRQRHPEGAAYRVEEGEN